MDYLFDSLETGPLQVNCYLFGSQESGEAVIVDPGGDAGKILRRLTQMGLRPGTVILTHGHFDHIGAAAELQRASNCDVLLHADDLFLVEEAANHASEWGIPFGNTPKITGFLQDGQHLELGGVTLDVLHTPGHTPGGVCLKVGTNVVVGDSLFAGSIGRTDLPGGDYDQLIRSIRTQLLTLPDNTRCLPGHGPATTIGQERRGNPFIA
ncbi:MAG: MBL fold metallo-hydrolase [Magnetococcales bacterium]|nr:MBL fold metallo-hydrolase [Magnetococcales bacterium]